MLVNCDRLNGGAGFVKMIYGFLVALSAKWHGMAPKDQIYAAWHACFDLILFAMLLAFLWNGMHGDLVVFVFWVPFLTIAIIFRLKQARERWSL